MSKDLYALSDGTYSFSETEVENRYLFYRNDGGVLGDVGRIPMDFYQSYIAHKMMSGGITDIVMNDIEYETSYDGKFIRLTVSNIGERKETETQDYKSVEETERQLIPAEEQLKTNFLKRLFKRIFGE